MYYLFSLLIFGFTLTSCGQTEDRTTTSETASGEKTSTSVQSANLDTATFAGGCFWCIEASFEQIQGVEEAVSGYAGGTKKNPTYQQVASGKTDYAESVQVYYNPAVITYSTLLDIFFTAHDPTQLNRQGPDVGRQYRSAIFYHNSHQKRQAEQTMTDLNNSGRYDKAIVTELKPLQKFYKAVEHHQDYEEKHPNDPYIRNVSRPKIERVRQQFPQLLKKQ